MRPTTRSCCHRSESSEVAAALSGNVAVNSMFFIKCDLLSLVDRVEVEIELEKWCRDLRSHVNVADYRKRLLLSVAAYLNLVEVERRCL